MYSPTKLRQSTDCGRRGLAVRSASPLLQQCLKALNDLLLSILEDVQQIERVDLLEPSFRRPLPNIGVRSYSDFAHSFFSFFARYLGTRVQRVGKVVIR